MKNYIYSRALLVALTFGLFVQSQSGLAQKSTQDKLVSFAESYKADPMAMNSNFGIKVAEEWWAVTVARKEEGYAMGKQKQYTFHNYGPNEVTIIQGKPAQPTWYFRLADRETLDKVNEKIWTASTASAKSTPADVVAMDIEDMEGFTSDQEATAIAYMALEHFWKKDAVEVTQFSRGGSLPSHGTEIVSLYTMKDKRIAWFSIGPEEAANADRGLDKSQVPNLFIITKGRGKGLIGDEEIELKPGMSVFVAPYMKHVIFNPYDEPLEGILVLYGDNIDYATGQSYMSFLEEEYAFYGKNEKAVKKQSSDKHEN